MRQRTSRTAHALRLALLAALLTGRGPGMAAAQDTIPLAPYGSGALRQLAVVVAGDTLNFLFDTGAGVTVISPEVAAQVGCTPSGRSHGYRMTGEHLEGPVCRDVPLQIAGYATRAEASVLDLMALLGPNAPVVHGMISLRTFAGRALTLDLRARRLIVESAATLAARVRDMRPLPVRLATGLEGGMLDAYIGVPAGDAELWLLWDSGNQGPTFLAPWAAAALGITGPAGEHALAFGGRDVTVPVQVKDIIHDGVLNARLVERAVWSIDLANARMWVSDVAPLLAPPPAAPGARVIPTRTAATGWYELTLVVNGAPQRSLLHVHENGAELRFIGEERVFELADVRARQARLDFTLPMNRPYPVQLVFDGLRGRGSWGDGERGGAAEAVKVR